MSGAIVSHTASLPGVELLAENLPHPLRSVQSEGAILGPVTTAPPLPHPAVASPSGIGACQQQSTASPATKVVYQSSAIPASLRLVVGRVAALSASPRRPRLALAAVTVVLLLFWVFGYALLLSPPRAVDGQQLAFARVASDALSVIRAEGSSNDEESPRVTRRQKPQDFQSPVLDGAANEGERLPVLSSPRSTAAVRRRAASVDGVAAMGAKRLSARPFLQRLTEVLASSCHGGWSRPLTRSDRMPLTPILRVPGLPQSGRLSSAPSPVAPKNSAAGGEEPWPSLAILWIGSDGGRSAEESDSRTADMDLTSIMQSLFDRVVTVNSRREKTHYLSCNHENFPNPISCASHILLREGARFSHVTIVHVRPLLRWLAAEDGRGVTFRRGDALNVDDVRAFLCAVLSRWQRSGGDESFLPPLVIGESVSSLQVTSQQRGTSPGGVPAQSLPEAECRALRLASLFLHDTSMEAMNVALTEITGNSTGGGVRRTRASPSQWSQWVADAGKVDEGGKDDGDDASLPRVSATAAIAGRRFHRPLVIVVPWWLSYRFARMATQYLFTDATVVEGSYWFAQWLPRLGAGDVVFAGRSIPDAPPPTATVLLTSHAQVRSWIGPDAGSSCRADAATAGSSAFPTAKDDHAFAGVHPTNAASWSFHATLPLGSILDPAATDPSASGMSAAAVDDGAPLAKVGGGLIPNRRRDAPGTHRSERLWYPTLPRTDADAVLNQRLRQSYRARSHNFYPPTLVIAIKGGHLLAAHGHLREYIDYAMKTWRRVVVLTDSPVAQNYHFAGGGISRYCFDAISTVMCLLHLSQMTFIQRSGGIMYLHGDAFINPLALFGQDDRLEHMMISKRYQYHPVEVKAPDDWVLWRDRQRADTVGPHPVSMMTMWNHAIATLAEYFHPYVAKMPSFQESVRKRYNYFGDIFYLPSRAFEAAQEMMHHFAGHPVLHEASIGYLATFVSLVTHDAVQWRGFEYQGCCCCGADMETFTHPAGHKVTLSRRDTFERVIKVFEDGSICRNADVVLKHVKARNAGGTYKVAAAVDPAFTDAFAAVHEAEVASEKAKPTPRSLMQLVDYKQLLRGQDASGGSQEGRHIRARDLPIPAGWPWQRYALEHMSTCRVVATWTVPAVASAAGDGVAFVAGQVVAPLSNYVDVHVGSSKGDSPSSALKLRRGATTGNLAGDEGSGARGAVADTEVVEVPSPSRPPVKSLPLQLVLHTPNVNHLEVTFQESFEIPVVNDQRQGDAQQPPAPFTLFVNTGVPWPTEVRQVKKRSGERGRDAKAETQSEESEKTAGRTTTAAEPPLHNGVAAFCTLNEDDNGLVITLRPGRRKVDEAGPFVVPRGTRLVVIVDTHRHWEGFATVEIRLPPDQGGNNGGPTLDIRCASPAQDWAFI